MSTWLDDVQTALKNLGGEAHLSKIFDEVKRIRKNLNPSWTRTIQKELERHSSDSSVWNSKYRGKEDLFSFSPIPSRESESGRIARYDQGLRG